MRQFCLSELTAPLAATLAGDDARFEAVSTDTRTLRPGELFVALKGERFDGHRFVGSAAAAGACAALVSEPLEISLPLLRVDDTERALGQLAALNRREFAGPLIGITGSCGKTSVKNMLAAILATAGATLATRGNYNNEIGMPLTLLELSPEHRYAVIEMGAAKPGDIAYLCALARPQIAVLLNALPAHLETMGSVEGIARIKGDILSGLDGQGTAVYPGDSEFTGLWRQLAGPANRLEFGFGNEADVFADELQLDEQGSRFTIHAAGEAVRVSLSVPGRHNVANALAAAAAAIAAGLSCEQVAAGLAAFEAEGGRLARRRIAGDITLIDDSYNANPASVKAAIDVLATSDARRVLVLGTMAELGADSEALHAEVGRYGRERGIDALWVTGEHTAAAAEAFGAGGRCFENREALVEELRSALQPGDVVLVKGSRSAGMDTVVAALADSGEG
jgi:UDP-N-acetylmuramoyl-tripeptide--D-alanyl-D-alanine ligase